MDDKKPEQLTLGAGLDPRAPELPEGREFVKLEKNLSSIGFFSPSTKNVKKGAKPKVLSFSAVVDGTRVKASVTINPSVMDGLPTTAHQDKTFAFYKLLQDRRRFGEEVANPVGFHSSELLRLLGKRVRTGKNYDEVDDWLNVMTFTGIISEGAVYHAGAKEFGKDRYHVFERSVSYGKKLPDGTVADRNYVWLSEWQLENINSNYFLPVDFEAYKRLRNHTAKALVPLLQVWLYASEGQGAFVKSYDDLCQHLNLQSYRYPSQVRQKLSPALDELVAVGYLAAWDLQRTADGAGFKVVFEHGPKFFEDKALRAGQRPGARRPLPERTPPALPAAAPAAPSVPPSAPAAREEIDAAEALVRAFHQAFHGRGEAAEPLRKEVERAAALIARYGPERAAAVVPYALRELASRSYRPDTFGGIAHLAAEAAAEYDAAREAEARKREEAARRKAGRDAAEARKRDEADRADAEMARLEAEDPAAYGAFAAYAEEQRRKALARFAGMTESAKARMAGHFDAPAKRRELFREWRVLPEDARRAYGAGRRTPE